MKHRRLIGIIALVIMIIAVIGACRTWDYENQYSDSLLPIIIVGAVTSLLALISYFSMIFGKDFLSIELAVVVFWIITGLLVANLLPRARLNFSIVNQVFLHLYAWSSLIFPALDFFYLTER